MEISQIGLKGIRQIKFTIKEIEIRLDAEHKESEIHTES